MDLVAVLLFVWLNNTSPFVRRPQEHAAVVAHAALDEVRWLWGWPDKFLQRMDEANTRVVLVQCVDGWSAGLDPGADLAKLPRDYTGAVWTNRVDIVAPLLKEDR